MLPVDKGTYLLLLETAETGPLRVGRRIELQLQPGWYGYVGSAFGPGGLAARLGHHLRADARARWHIDFLRQHARPVEIWFACQDRGTEHRWAEILAEWRPASVPHPGFGSSDCGCRSHLVHFARRPSVGVLRRRLRDGLAANVPLHHRHLEPAGLKR